MSQSFVLSQHNEFGSAVRSKRFNGQGGAGRAIKETFQDMWDYLKDWKRLPDVDVRLVACKRTFLVLPGPAALS